MHAHPAAADFWFPAHKGAFVSGRQEQGQLIDYNGKRIKNSSIGRPSKPSWSITQ
ncbi:hypothetical protein O181_109189, partial [Austropuccinia psidii MF-1]|nr:hypothetical protein [Austropuccinia psidii MF-1]